MGIMLVILAGPKRLESESHVPREIARADPTEVRVPIQPYEFLSNQGQFSASPAAENSYDGAEHLVELQGQ